MASINSDIHDMTVSQMRSEAMRIAVRLNKICDRLYEKDIEYELAHDAGDCPAQEVLTDLALILGDIEQHNVDKGRHQRTPAADRADAAHQTRIEARAA
ncbi:hypothetical protein U0C82_03915 [Fulvimarina sp. 2208YS6-2-32]|uniref:Uncharacterized protein n=1 Tax=Fulvimarina uroteuthidis TaxID=3098149 RepID=A0ABU5HZA8_9HYPH|nr:hypothetical protein [Fulvimarina sp. 2208YS6-2-32]MDY8108296.1 hypothetical protein [Fulvimarina sp. 2208YS6-2-32]